MGGILSGKRDIPRAIIAGFVNNILLRDKKVLVFIPKVPYSMLVTIQFYSICQGTPSFSTRP
jgi:hypothetical protein